MFVNSLISLKQSKLSLPDLQAQQLADIIESTAIKWKVIVNSSCYSSKFIEPLKNDTTLIIAASDDNRTSFGCADPFSYFDSHHLVILSEYLKIVEFNEHLYLFPKENLS